MTDDPRVAQLLDELLDSHATPEEVCGACPELLPEVRTRWRQMCRVRAEIDALFPATLSPTAAPSLSHLSPGGTALPQIPGYEVQSVLGRGGMGVVFRARHLRLNRVVALKMVLAGAYAGPQERERFQREAEAVAGLRHPNVVQIHDVGESDGRPYFTMEFVEGGSLAQRLDGTPLPARRAAALVAALAGAVHAAHRSGIIHRDLKPANVLLTATDEAPHTGDRPDGPAWGVPKISDFGLARRLDGESDLTRTGVAIGTPSYMAPEQAGCKGAGVGPAADVYALGAILYELLTGRPPHRAESLAETLLQVISRDPAPPSRLNAKVPCDLETVCLKCLHKEPRLRYAGAAALAEDLDRFLKGEAIGARPERRWERVVRRARRRPVLSTALAAGVLFAVAAVGGGLWLLSERAAATRQADAERAATERAVEDDLRDAARLLRASSWPEARAALERARGRLGDRGSSELHNRLDHGTRDLDLVTRLDAVRLSGSDSIGGVVALGASDEAYEDAFRVAGLGQVHDDTGAVAAAVERSDVRAALVAALDHWSICARDQRRNDWILEVARKADPDATGWRVRARTPAARNDPAALAELIATARVGDQPASLLIAIERHLSPTSPEHASFLKRVQQAHPHDFWVNYRLAYVVYQMGKTGEAVGYFRAAMAIRPNAALVCNNLGRALAATGRAEESLELYRRAVVLDPTAGPVWSNLALGLWHLGRHGEAIEHLRTALRFNPDSAMLHTALGYSLESEGKYDEALAQHAAAVGLDPKRTEAQKGLRDFLMHRGRADEARVAWRKALEADPPEHAAWYGYAEFCLFLGDADEYRRARRALLAKFGATTDPYVAERTARACLLLPASEDDLRRAAALADRAVGAARRSPQGAHAHFAFAQGLAEYRQGRFDRAAAVMRGDAAGVLGPAPRLVLALALHRTGQTAEARKVLAAAVAAHDWRTNQVRDQDDWIFHALRREAEGAILPDLAAFLDGKHRPRDNDERLALFGACQAANRSLAAAQLYADAFAANPQLAEDFRSGYRSSAARAAALAGRGTDAAALGERERERWRRQARLWLRADLSAWNGALNSAPAANRGPVLSQLAKWRSDPDLAGLREASELAELPADEQNDCRALWEEVGAVLGRAEKVR